MATLIDREALMEIIQSHDYPLVDRIGSIDRGMFTVGIRQAVDEALAVDAVEVVHGRWIEASVNTEGFFAERQHKCSVCNGVTPYGNHGGYWYWRYCPHCGARMDKEDK